jgi:hypothetical protein
MPDDQMDFLKSQFEYQSWATPEQRDENVFVWRFDAANMLLEGLTLDRSQTVAPSNAGQAKAVAGQRNAGIVSVTDSTWSDPGKPEVLLHLSTIECDSRITAREQLLRMLAEFQGPIIKRDDFAGEVGFANDKKTVGLLVRGNLVVVLHNGGTRLAAVVPPLRRFDRSLTARDEPPAAEISARAGKDRFALGGRTPLIVEPPGGSSIRILAEGGEVRIQKGHPVYEPHIAGTHRVRLFVLRGGQSVAGKTLTIEAR